MSVQSVAAEHYRQRVALARRIAGEMAALWRALNTSDLDGSWAGASARAFALVSGGQALAASQADSYVTSALHQQDVDPQADGTVNPRSLAGVASDGRPLDSLLFEPVIAVKALIGQGASVSQAMASGLIRLDTITRTQIADAGRVADGIAVAARKRVGGYVRMLNPPSCSRCAILAGHWYRWNKGFQRHPRCDCTHIPASEDRSDDLRTEPGQYFRSLSESEQDRLFTKAGAQAIRDGADMGQVVNARRGMYTAGGRSFTREGTTRRGLAGKRLEAQGAGVEKRDGGWYRLVAVPRLTPEQIYTEAAGDRDEAIRLLRRFAYIF